MLGVDDHQGHEEQGNEPLHERRPGLHRTASAKDVVLGEGMKRGAEVMSLRTLSVRMRRKFHAQDILA